MTTLFMLSVFTFFSVTTSAAKANEEEKSQCRVYTETDSREDYDGVGVLKTKNECIDLCEEEYMKTKDTDKIVCKWDSGGVLGSSWDDVSPESCSFTKTPVLCLLSPVLWFVRMILVAGATFLSWVIATENLKLVLGGGGAIRSSWVVVRDLLNISFVLVLLFSAFATIFQVSKFNYKKILLTLVLMALLVNFSYPIARTIIDFSNVMMYSLVKVNFSFDSKALFFSADITKQSGLDVLLRPRSYPNAGVMLLGAIFVFIFGITLFGVAIMLFIRLMALALLLVFSPIGFVGNIIPGFEGFAKKWWKNLFEYAFFGPIVILGLNIALKLTTNIYGMGAMQSVAKKAAPSADANILGSIAFLMIPLVLIWSVLLLAKKSSTVGAGMVMGKTQGVLKKAGLKLSGGNFAKNTYTKYKEDRKERKAALGKASFSSRAGAIAASGMNKAGEFRDSIQGKERWQSLQEQTGDSKWKKRFKKAGRIVAPGNNTYAQDRMKDLRRKKIQEQRKEWKDAGGANDADLRKILNDENESTHVKQAAALELAENNKFQGETAYSDFSRAMEILENDKALQNTASDNVNKKRTDLVLTYKADQVRIEAEKKGDTKEQAQQKSNEFMKNKLKGMQESDIHKINFKELLDENTKGTNKETKEAIREATMDFFRSYSDVKKTEFVKKGTEDNVATLSSTVTKDGQKGFQTTITNRQKIPNNITTA